MNPDTVISVSRQGAIIGQFTLSAVRSGLVAGKFSSTDSYWAKGMPGWEPLAKLPAEQKAQAPSPNPAPSPDEASAPTVSMTLPTPPPRPPQQAAAAPAKPTTSSATTPPGVHAVQKKLIGNALCIIGALVFLHGLLTDPEGSAIRQQVLVQRMTNGLLFAILGLMVRKTD